MTNMFRLIGKMLLSLLMLCCLTDFACPGAYDVTQRRLDQIPAGTIIGKTPPKGWTNLLIKSHPHPGAGDTKKLSATADRLSRLLFTAIVADVKPESAGGDKHYRLAKVAVGLGTRIGDRDVIITPETQRRLGAGLGLLAGVVLRTAQDKLADIVIVARSDTLMIFDAPGLLACDGRHEPVVLRYAVLVEERTGQLNTLLWVLDREPGGGYGGPAGAIQWLPPNKIEDCILHVDAGEFSLGQPTEKAFAMRSAPKGRQEIAVTDDLRPLVVRRRFTPAKAAELEGKLREALKQAAEK